MQFEGKITHILDVETIGENATPKQTVVLEEVTDREYPASITVDFRRDKVELLANISVGDVVKLWLNTRAREYNGKWYNSVSAWRMDVVTDGGTAAAPATSDEVDDDLPF